MTLLADGIARVVKRTGLLCVNSKAEQTPALLLTGVMIATVRFWALGYRIVDAAPSQHQSHVFCVRELHNVRLRRRDSRRSLAASWTNDSDECVLLFGRSTAVIFEVLRRAMARNTRSVASDQSPHLTPASTPSYRALSAHAEMAKGHFRRVRT